MKYLEKKSTTSIPYDIIWKKIKFLLIPLLIICSIQLISCGKKNQIHTVGGNLIPNPTANPNPTQEPLQPAVAVPVQPNLDPKNYVNQEMLTQINLVKTKYPCRNGGPRIEKTFYVANKVNTTGLLQSNLNSNINEIPMNGQITSGPEPTGKINKVYIGIFQGYNDLLIVRDYTDNDRITSRGVTISLCENKPIIMAERPIQIRLLTNITIKDNANCLIGDTLAKFEIIGNLYGVYQAYSIPEVFTYFPQGGSCLPVPQQN